jgi:gamma-glutamyl-gamma-aminobutyrate hydrolase PuuD
MPADARRPLIGVTMYRQETSWWAWNRDAVLVPSPYVDLVAGAGGRSLLLPPADPADGGPEAGADEVVAALDGLVLIGGGDIDPSSFGQDPDPRIGGVNPVRDRTERALLAAALRADLPVLAICRGHQLLNVHLGGDLVQYLPDVVGTTVHQPRAGAFGEVTVRTVAGSRTAAIVGPEVDVLCCHHQAIGVLADGLAATARSDDGVIEAVELPGRRFVVGVQWHPEETGDIRLFTALVESAREYRSAGPVGGGGGGGGGVDRDTVGRPA